MKTFRASIAIALAAFLGLAASWCPARAQGTLVNGARSTGLISFVGDKDTWTFSADSGAAIVVRVGETVAGSLLTPNVTLYGPDKAQLMTSYAQSEAEVVKTAPSTGTYTVVVSDRYSGSGGYRITMVKTGSPVGGGPLTNGAKYTGTIEIGDLDAWTVDATNGDAIVVRVGKGFDTGSTLVPAVRIFSPAGGNELAHGSPGTGGSAGEVSIHATVPGPYLVIASDWYTVNIGGSGGYDLTMVKTGSPVTTSPGDEGGPLVNGATYLGTLEYGDLDAWTVDAAKGEEIIVRSGEVVAGSPLAPGLRIFSPRGVELGHSSIYSVNEVAIQAPDSGQYVVIAGDATQVLNGSGNYRVTMAKTGAPVTTAPKGGPLANGAKYSGKIAIGGLDAWTVDATKGDAIIVRIGRAQAESTLVPEVRIYGPAGGNDLAHDSRTVAGEVSIHAPVSGQYLVIASDWLTVNNSTSGDYHLTMVKTPSPVTTSPGDEGGPLAPGLSAGTLEVGDLDPWTLTANKGDHLIVTMEEIVPGSSLFPYLRLYSPKGVLVAYGSNTSFITVSATAPDSGTYIVIAGDQSSGWGGSGTYRLTPAATTDAPRTASHPTALTLAPPAPNPFMASTVLHYALPRAAAVTLRIFDLQGRVVRTLAEDANKPAGEYDATWDGRDGQGRAAGAGVYFARLASEGHTEMRRVMLAR
jgi:hypothetical protein